MADKSPLIFPALRRFLTASTSAIRNGGVTQADLDQVLDDMTLWMTALDTIRTHDGSTQALKGSAAPETAPQAACLKCRSHHCGHPK